MSDNTNDNAAADEPARAPAASVLKHILGADDFRREYGQALIACFELAQNAVETSQRTMQMIERFSVRLDALAAPESGLVAQIRDAAVATVDVPVSVIREVRSQIDDAAAGARAATADARSAEKSLAVAAGTTLSSANDLLEASTQLQLQFKAMNERIVACTNGFGAAVGKAIERVAAAETAACESIRQQTEAGIQQIQRVTISEAEIKRIVGVVRANIQADVNAAVAAQVAKQKPAEKPTGILSRLTGG